MTETSFSSLSTSKKTPSTPLPSDIRAFDFVQPPATSDDLIGAVGSRNLLQVDDAIQVVLEAMREQRMSLCQTLRQYVFAHRAIIEGALEIIDEIETKDKSRGKQNLSQSTFGEISYRRSSVKRRYRGESLSHSPASKARQK